MQWPARVNARGFSLIETVVAVSILTVALSSLLYLFVMSAAANADARRATFASVLAGQKMEELRSQGANLLPQGIASLSDNVDGLCDFLDEYGRSLGSGATPPSGTVYVRRWSIESLPSDPANTLVLQVIVMRPVLRGGAAGAPWSFGGAQMVTLKTRRAG